MEWYSAYLYLDIHDYYIDQELDGFGNWFYIQTQEERDHAMLFVKYLQNNNCRIRLVDVKAPNMRFSDFREPAVAAFKHEKTLGEVYAVIHDLQLRILHKYGVVMVFGMYAVDADDPEQRELRRVIARFVAGCEHVVSYHALYLPHGAKQLYCDLVVDYEMKDRDKLETDFRAFIGGKYPDFEIILTIETEYV